jgi:phosphatidylglycerophosphatase A
MTHPLEAALPAPRPTVRFLLAHPAHFIALGFGAGLSPIAPGTAGTAWAWLAYLVMAMWLNPAQIGIVIGIALVVGWWACAVTATSLNSPDPGSIVWDEVVSFWIVLWLVMPAGFAWQVAAFLIFRVFDAVKPGPIGWADGLFAGFGWRAGFGVLFDDLMAAFCTLLALALMRTLL